MKPAEISASLPKSRISVPGGNCGAMRSAGPNPVILPSAMTTIASGSWTIVVSRPSRNGSPEKLSTGPRTAVGREGGSAIDMTLALKAGTWKGGKIARSW